MVASAGRRGLDEPRGQVARFRQQVETNLGHMGTRGDVDEVIFFLHVEGVSAREIRQRAVHLFKVPRIAEFDDVPAHLGLRRDAADVGCHGLREVRVMAVVQEFETADKKLLVLADRHGGTPGFPAGCRFALVKLRSEQTENHEFLFCHSR